MLVRTKHLDAQALTAMRTKLDEMLALVTGATRPLPAEVVAELRDMILQCQEQHAEAYEGLRAEIAEVRDAQPDEAGSPDYDARAEIESLRALAGRARQYEFEIKRFSSGGIRSVTAREVPPSER